MKRTQSGTSIIALAPVWSGTAVLLSVFSVWLMVLYQSEAHRGAGAVSVPISTKRVTQTLKLSQEFVLWWMQAIDFDGSPPTSDGSFVQSWMLGSAIVSFEKVFGGSSPNNEVKVICRPVFAYTPKWTKDGLVEVSVLTAFVSQNRQTQEVYGFDLETLTFEVGSEPEGLRILGFSMREAPKNRLHKFLVADFLVNRHIFKSKGIEDVEAVRLWCLAFNETNNSTRIALLSRALELNKSFALAYGLRGEAKASLGRRHEALRDCDYALELNADDSEVRYSRGTAHDTLGDISEAIVDYTAIIEAEPNRFYGAYTDRARMLKTQGRLEAAIADCDHSIGLEPENATAYLVRGLANDQLGNSGEALKDFEHAIRIEPTPLSYEVRGNLRERLQDYAGAIADFSELISIKPSSDSFVLRGDAREKYKDFNGALQDYDEAIKLNEYHFRAYANRGFLKRTVDVNACLSDLRKAITIEPKYPWPYIARSFVRERNGDVRGALKDANAFLKLAPRNAFGYKVRGDLHLRLKQLSSAKRDYTKSLKLDSRTEGSHLGLAVLFQKRGEFRAALNEVNRAIALSPNEWQLYSFRSWIWDKLGKAELAKADLKKMLALDKARFISMKNNPDVDLRIRQLANSI